MNQQAAIDHPTGKTYQKSATPTKFDFTKPAGEPAYQEPGSVHWRVFKNSIALAIGGVAAVLLEFADARIRSGVWDHSVYPVDPIGRSQRTGMAAMLGVYGPKGVARQVIGGVNRMHTKVSGVTPSGEAYTALDPELLDWVSATAQYGFVTAYDRFVHPLTDEEKHAYWTGQINSDFLEIIASGKSRPEIPKFIHRALARAAVDILPPVVRQKLELGREWDLSWYERVLVRFVGRAADRKIEEEHPAYQAALRLGLPGDTAWRR